MVLAYPESDYAIKYAAKPSSASGTEPPSGAVPQGGRLTRKERRAAAFNQRDRDGAAAALRFNEAASPSKKKKKTKRGCRAGVRTH